MPPELMCAPAVIHACHGRLACLRPPTQYHGRAPVLGTVVFSPYPARPAWPCTCHPNVPGSIPVVASVPIINIPGLKGAGTGQQCPGT